MPDQTIKIAGNLNRRKSDEIFAAIMEWTANIILWAGGSILAVSPELAKGSWKVFAALFVGQLLWGVSAFAMRKWSLFASCVFFALLNIYGVIARL